MNNFVTVLLMVIGSLVNNVYSQNNIIWGAVGPNDVHLFRERVIEPIRHNQVVTKNVLYPPAGQSQDHTITAIVLTDVHTDGNGGYATLQSGGPGQTHATVHFVSALGHSVNYIMEVYGRRI
uniref:Venom polypeptide n=1 Tax=Dolopus genitalis TaxID=2488630 RepID=A0A3G5BIE5_DOLGE|nr:venom polypeptide [Dolopus genitalis]